MNSAENKKKAKKRLPEKKEKTGFGFESSAEGIVVPDNVIEKKNPDGTYSYYFPDGKKWRP